jgi:hypothetical protein
MPNSNALDPQSPQARAIYDLTIHSTVFVPWLFIHDLSRNSFGEALGGLT